MILMMMTAFPVRVIMAFVIFLIARWANRLMPKADATPAAPPEDIVLLREIRDSLRR